MKTRKEYRVAAIFDTETTNIGEGAETRAYPISRCGGGGGFTAIGFFGRFEVFCTNKQCARKRTFVSVFYGLR